MEGNRVRSKNLFNFRPAGVIDSDILAQEKAMYDAIGAEGGNMFAKMESMSDEEFGVILRGMMDGYLDSVLNNSLFTEVLS